MIQRTRKDRHPEGSIHEQFAYTQKLSAYRNNSDITELSEIRLGGLSIDLKSWEQLRYYGGNNHEPKN